MKQGHNFYFHAFWFWVVIYTNHTAENHRVLLMKFLTTMLRNSLNLTIREVFYL